MSTHAQGGPAGPATATQAQRCHVQAALMPTRNCLPSMRLQRGSHVSPAAAVCSHGLVSTVSAPGPHRQRPGSMATIRRDRAVPRAAAAAAAPAASSEKVLEGRSVAIIGGGPAGMLTAAHMARLGADVTVFEKLSPQDQKIPPSVWAICLGKIASDAIASAGLNPEFEERWRAMGSSSQMAGTPPKFVGPWAGEDEAEASSIYSTQPLIVEHIRRETERVYGPDRVTVEHSVRVVGGDVPAGKLLVECDGGEQEERGFELVVAADGVASAARSLITKEDSSLTVDQPRSSVQFLPLSLSPQGDPTTYATLPTPSGNPIQLTPPSLSAPSRGTCTAFFRAGPDAEAGIQLLLFTIWAGGEQVGALFGCSADWFAADRPAEERLAALEAAFPDVPTVWLQESADALAGGSLQMRTPTFVTCSKLGSGRAVIVGDAAHALSPNVAAGCNAGLQDAAVLAQSIQAVGGDLDKVAEHFTASRLADVQAITRISRQIDDVLSYGFHGDLQRTLRGVPIAVTLILSALPKDSSWPQWLRPQGSFTSMMQASDSFDQVDQDAKQLFYRLLGVLIAPLVVVAVTASALSG